MSRVADFRIGHQPSGRSPIQPGLYGVYRTSKNIFTENQTQPLSSPTQARTIKKHAQRRIVRNVEFCGYNVALASNHRRIKRTDLYPARLFCGYGSSLCVLGFQLEADEVFRNMAKRTDADGLERALCFLIVFGSSPGTKPFEGNFSLTKDSMKVSEQLMNGIVMKEMRVPYNDEFGLSAAFNAKPTPAQLEADLFASHDFLNAHTSDDNLTASSALYSGVSAGLTSKFTALWNALKNNR